MHEVVTIPVKDIVTHPDQPRYTDGDLKKLIASIEEVGMVEPIAVAKLSAGHYMVISGHRRLQATKKMGVATINAVVVYEGISDDEAKNTVGALVAANSAREDFTPAERAKVFQRMLDLGITTESIVKTTGRPKYEVEGTIDSFKTIEEMGNGTKRIKNDLTLDEAYALAEAEKHKELVPDGVEKILEAIETDEVDHAAAWLARKIDEAEEEQRIKDEHPGLRFISTPYGESTAERLTNLTTKEGEELTPENHAECPGHCAYLQSWGREQVVYCCADPKQHGHKTKRQKSEHEQAELDKARAGRQFKKDMIAPTTVRRKFLKEKLLAGDVTKLRGVFPYMLKAAASRRSNARTDLFFELIGKKRGKTYASDEGVIEKLTGAKAAKALLASFISVDDEDMRLSQGPEHFRSATIPDYLAFLKLNGYKTNEHEEKLSTYEKPVYSNPYASKPDDEDVAYEDSVSSDTTDDETWEDYGETA